MLAIACVIFTAAGCYFSFGLGHEWWLAWFAPVPVLWLVFGEPKPWLRVALTRGVWSNPATAADAWFHARNALPRSVENGVPMARSALRGLLTLNDRYGRIVAETRTNGEFTTLTGDLPLDVLGGSTFYDRVGDVLGWLCLALGTGLIGTSLRIPSHGKRS